MTDRLVSKLIARMVAGRPIVVLCAPPGFRKAKLANEAARRISSSNGLALRQFGLIEHNAAPSAVAEALLQEKYGCLVVENVGAADGRLLVHALERIDADAHCKRVIVVLNQFGDLPMARMAVHRSVDILDADALRLRSHDVTEAIKSTFRPNLRARISNLAGDWPIALDLLCAWGAASRDDWAGWSDLDIVRDSRLGEFIVQEILPLLTPAELRALVHASLLDNPDLAILAAVGSHKEDGNILGELAFRLKGLVDRHGDRIVLQGALRTWLRDAVEAIDNRDRVQLLVSTADQYSRSGRLAEAAALTRMAGNTSPHEVYRVQLAEKQPICQIVAGKQPEDAKFHEDIGRLKKLVVRALPNEWFSRPFAARGAETLLFLPCASHTELEELMRKTELFDPERISAVSTFVAIR